MEMELIDNNEAERKRLSVLEEYGLLDENFDQDFQNIVELAAYICEVPSSLVSIVGENRQWFKAKKGNTTNGSARDISFCGHAICQEGLFIVQDARKDSRFQNSPLVTKEPHIIFYAGFPIKIENQNLGVLCVHDSLPRELTAEQVAALKLLTNQAAKLVELRGKEKKLTKNNELILQRNEELQTSTSINKQLMSMISHDVRGPVGSILTFFKSKHGAADDPVLMKKILPLIETSLRGIYNMVDNMLEWSNHINNTKIEIVDITELVENCRHIYSSQLNIKGNTLEILVDKANKVACDKEALLFVLRNLIGNAIKYTENGKITVASKIIKDKVEISVIDTGSGMSEILLENILKKDKKVSTNGTQQEKGSGMGINFTQQFLAKMDSQLHISSVEKEGSTFSFSLPIAS